MKESLPSYLIPKNKNKIHLQTNEQNLIIIYYQGYQEDGKRGT